MRVFVLNHDILHKARRRRREPPADDIFQGALHTDQRKNGFAGGVVRGRETPFNGDRKGHNERKDAGFWGGGQGLVP